ncbi:MAG: HD domain-containing protein [Firmicutes bacterium]|nr:HD domain-containing protein [Bacillota bacterium]
MRRLDIREIPHDAVLARPLVDERGAFVLAAGKEVSLPVRERLWNRGFRHAFVEQTGFEGIEPTEPLEPQTYFQVRRLLLYMADQVRHAKSLSDVDIPAADLTQLAGMACNELARLKGDFLLYPVWGGMVDRWAALAVNFAVVAARLALDLLSPDDASVLFVAGLLQDLGQWRCERIEDHVTASEEIVRGIRSLNAWSKRVIADHHERLDGSGYPRGKKGDDLAPVSRIMAAAVAYVELLHHPRHPALPHEAQEALMAEVDAKFDRKTVELLRRRVPAYPVGTVVRLSTGKLGVVVQPGPPGLSRPRVRLLGNVRVRSPQASAQKAAEERRPGEEAAWRETVEATEDVTVEPEAAELETIEPDAADEDGDSGFQYVEIDLAKEHAVTITRVLKS